MTLDWLPTPPADPYLDALERFVVLAGRASAPYVPHVVQHWTANPGPQTEFYWSAATEVMYGGAAGGGKALHVDTPIPTPTGWTTMGELMPGDEVFDEAGRPCRVLWCSDVRTDRLVFEVAFSDGTTLIADSDHQWVTSTVADRAAMLRLDPAWRERRKARRVAEHARRAAARRATPGKQGGKGKSARPDLAAANAARAYAYKPLPVPAVKTTAQIAATLRIGAKRLNHAIAVAGALTLPDRELPIDPYVLGLWLGDGTSSGSGMTTADAEIVEALRAAGFDVHKNSGPYAWGVCGGLYRALRLGGLLGNKHVPAVYLRASEAQRLALLQGLMDTDGHADSRGQCEFTTTSEALRDGALELILSLGIKATVSEGRATLRGRDIGAKYRIKFVTDKPAFRLARKLGRQKRDGFRGTHDLRYVVSVYPIPSCPVRCIGVDSPSRMFLAGRTMVPTHNSASEIALPLRWCNHRAFRALILRRETTQLQDLIDKADALYPREYPGATWRGDELTWTFPSGAVVRFGHVKDVSDWKKYQGHEYHLVEFDELTHFLLPQYREIKSRVRSSVAELPRFTRSATNPGGPGHAWVFKRWAPWLDPKCQLEDWTATVLDAERRPRTVQGTGLPPRPGLPPAAGGEVLWVVPTTDGERFSSAPVEGFETRTFIPARLTDNPKLVEADPTYAMSLLDNDPVRVAQLRDGNWLVKPAAGLFFKREWFEIVDVAPLEGPAVRCWDLAATEPSNDNPDPDWTVGVLGSKASDGFFYIEHVERFRCGPGEVRSRIRQTAVDDGREVTTRLPQDPGQAGKDQAASYIQLLEGYPVTTQTVTGAKELRWSGAASQASPHATGGATGRIRVVRGDWNEAFFEELEALPTGAHDDQADALADVIAELTLGGVAQVSAALIG